MNDSILKSQKLWIHVFTWLVLAVFLFLLDNGQENWWFSTTNVFLLAVFYMMLVYFNTRYLIPAFLSRKSFGTYFLLFLLACAILTPLRTLIFYLKFSGNPGLQEEVLSSQISTFFSFVAIGGFSTIAKMVIDWFESQRKMRSLQRETLQSELRFLRSQINPHFLFNTLNSLYALTLKKSEKAPEIVIRLSEIMRYMLYECNEPVVPLEKELKYMRNYIELEKLRYGDHVDIQFDVEGSVEDQMVAPLMFVPFFENSFKHGLSQQINHAFVHIQFVVEKDSVTLNVENSKPKKEEESSQAPDKKVGGIGLKNIKRRLELLYRKQHQLEIRESDDLYSVYLTIKLNEHENNESTGSR